MKSLMKILTRAVLSAAGIALILLAVNLTGLAVWTVQVGDISSKQYSTAQLAAGLTKRGGAYALSEDIAREIERNAQWAMLLDPSGTVIWSKDLPEYIPLQYTVADVAGFTRWYLCDHPVNVWAHPDGLFVVGKPRGSAWKYGLEVPMKVVEQTFVWIPILLGLNGVVALLLALLWGTRLFRALRPLAGGVEALAENRPVRLPVRGLLGDLAEGVNRASERLGRQEAALEKRDNARAAWIAGVSHDIRTPLSLVMGYAGQLEEDAALPPAARETAGVIRRQSERIKALVADLNLASKLEYDMQPLRLGKVYPAALVREAVAEQMNNGLDECFDLETKIQPEAQQLWFTGDEALLRRAVINLLGNSVRHNPEGCRIGLSLEAHEGRCVLRVADDGAGYPADVLEALRKPPNEGGPRPRGLGLLIVRQIIGAHGGTVSFGNREGGGCEAICDLPLGAPPKL